MSKVDVREAPAGAEMDVAVARVLGLDVVAMDWPCGCNMETGEFCAARKVCKYKGGWEPYTFSPLYDVRPYPVYVGEHGRWLPKPVEEDDKGLYRADVIPVPRYSTDIEAAWELVERETEGGDGTFDLSIEGSRVLHGIGTVTVTFRRIWDQRVKSETVPLAICRAWLLFKGIEEIEICVDS